jgi:L,D-transpeptidase ErfK/SrfK
MKLRYAAPLRAIAVGLPAMLLAACSLVNGTTKPIAPVEPPPPPPMPEPVATHRYEIDPENDDVIGVVQVTSWPTHEDTLPDIARRFNVGYEEIVRANPGVDPWLPGEGTEIVVPTQFILPNAPREGVVINLPRCASSTSPSASVRASSQVVYTHPIGIGKVGWKTPEGSHQGDAKTKDPTWTPPGPCAPSTRRTARSCRPRSCRRARTTRSAPTRCASAGRSTSSTAPTSPMASACARARLHPPLSRRHRVEVFEMVRSATPVRRQPAVRVRLAGDQLYLQAYDVLEDDPRDWQKAQKKLISRSLAAAHPAAAEVARRGGQLGRGLPARARPARHPGVGVRARCLGRGRAGSRAARAEPRACGRHLGWQGPTCRSTSRPSSRCSPTAIRRRRRRPPRAESRRGPDRAAEFPGRRARAWRARPTRGPLSVATLHFAHDPLPRRPVAGRRGPRRIAGLRRRPRGAADPHSLANLAAFRVRHLDLSLDVDFGPAAGSRARSTCGSSGPRCRGRRLVLDTRDLVGAPGLAGRGGRATRELPFARERRQGPLGEPLQLAVPAGRPARAFTVRVSYQTSPGASGLQWLTPAQTAGRRIRSCSRSRRRSTRARGSRCRIRRRFAPRSRRACTRRRAARRDGAQTIRWRCPPTAGSASRCRSRSRRT